MVLKWPISLSDTLGYGQLSMNHPSDINWEQLIHEKYALCGLKLQK